MFLSLLFPCHSARSRSEIRGLKTPLICLSFLRELRRVIIALICLINDRGIYPTFSGFARGSSYIIFSVRSLFKIYFLGVRSKFNTHNPAICQAYFLPLPKRNLTFSNPQKTSLPCGILVVISLEKKPCTFVKP